MHFIVFLQLFSMSKTCQNTQKKHRQINLHQCPNGWNTYSHVFVVNKHMQKLQISFFGHVTPNCHVTPER